ncbi:MAG TPA: hypothetical protein VM658_05565 [bacterium]|nr:hypothetical protein [bacterium]
MSKGAHDLIASLSDAGLPPASRFAYFPASQIFGKTIVPIYYSGARPTIPLLHIAGAIGISFKKAFTIVRGHRDVLDIFDAATCDLVPSASPLEPIKTRLCLGMDAICVLIFALDHNRVKDDAGRKRLIAAKRWFCCQVSNKIKISGRKNQPRWDAGLTTDQSRELKKLFARVNGQ